MSTPSRSDLLQRYARIGNDAANAAPVAPPVEITPVHREVIGILDELLSFVPHDAGPFAGLTKMLRRLEPALLRDFAKVPPEHVVSFLNQLGARMCAVGGERAAADTPAASAGLDQSQSA